MVILWRWSITLKLDLKTTVKYWMLYRNVFRSIDSNNHVSLNFEWMHYLCNMYLYVFYLLARKCQTVKIYTAKYFLRPKNKVPSILSQSVCPHQLSDRKSEYKSWGALLFSSVVRCPHLNTIKTVGLVMLFLKRVEFKNVKNQGKVGKNGLSQKF